MNLKLAFALMLSGILLTSCANTTSPKNATQDTNPMTQNTDFALPEIPPAKTFQHPLPTQMTLSNGAQFWYIQNALVPLMTLRVVFERGASGDDPNKSGCANFTAALLKEGANGKTAQQISDDIEYIGASISPAVTQDNALITIQVLSQFFENSLDILDEIWMHPDFTQESFSRIQKLILNGLKQRQDNPNAVAKLVSNAAYFEGHPYARSADGTEASISAVTLEDIKADYQAIFQNTPPVFFAVGNLPAGTVRDMLDKRFGARKLPEQAPAQAESFTNRQEKMRLIIVDKPAAPQTVIRIFQPAIPAPSLKTLTWQFLNIPFGGSFTSRLMQNIREDKGFSYGASSAVSAMKHAGVLLSTSSVAADVTGLALREFISELSMLPTGNFSQDEFERARETWKSEFVQSFETQSGALVTIAGLYLNRKPVSAINDFARQLESFTLDDFNAVAREFPTLDKATIVLVGDKNAILSQLKDLSDLNLPDPEFWSDQGIPVK
ncbi:MAG: insulinase family protein [Proteobacteria bacterium]|nr:insulinase family protein [Pseudomonadota bacterium]